MRIADSTALPFTTGIAPGRPRQVGQTCVLGSAPNSVGHPQNIFEAVLSSTWTSRPSAGSYDASTSSKATRVSVMSVPFQSGSLVEQRAAPLRQERSLERGPDPVAPVVGESRRQDLEAGRQAVLLGEAAGHRDP